MAWVRGWLLKRLLLILAVRDVFLSKLFRLREALDNQDPKPYSFLSILHSILRHVLTLSGILCTDTCGNADSFVPKGLQQIRERDLHNSISNLPSKYTSLPLALLHSHIHTPFMKEDGTQSQ